MKRGRRRREKGSNSKKQGREDRFFFIVCHTVHSLMVGCETAPKAGREERQGCLFVCLFVDVQPEILADCWCCNYARQHNRIKRKEDKRRGASNV
mmetsp:Transcript_30316/g.59600  ORF Transcript_30316/g.59600 Transcript_30316/m.59600 type:complete len:95 (+) Transcript_30316:903-1187(+)